MKKKQLLLIFLIVFCFRVIDTLAQTRYLNDVFPIVQKTSNIEYDSNVSVNLLYGSGSFPPALTTQFYTAKLNCDFYEPKGDTNTKRPLILLIHSGSFLPGIINKQVSGSKNDSSIVTLANGFARKGYVVAAIDYRLGWNPGNSNIELGQQQFLQAVFRGMQDVRNAVRFFRLHADSFKIDTSKIIIGGEGSGGFIALAIGTISKHEDLTANPKFLKKDSTPLVNMDTLGDWMGFGGILPYVYSGDSNVSANVHMVFNYGGAIFDSAWMKPGSLPLVSLQCVDDPFVPYHTGIISPLPIEGIKKLIAGSSGTGDLIPRANNMGINNKINTYRYLDPVSIRATQVTPLQNNIFGFQTTFPIESSPWESWDRSAVQSITSVLYRDVVSLPANGREADSLSLLTNPYMSAVRGKKYYDTIIKFVAPRIAVQLDLTGDLVLNPFSLLLPVSGSNITVRDTVLPVVIKWQRSNVPQAAPSSTQYYWMVDTDSGDFSSPFYIVPAGDNDSLVLSEKEIFDGLASLGLGNGQTAKLKWMVSAENNYFGRNANNSFFVNITLGFTQGINEFDESPSLTLFPNPAMNSISVILDQCKSLINQLQIFDISGREVVCIQGLKTNNQIVSLSGLSSGMYFMNVKTLNGDTATKRFIIQL